jgi:uncharacterized protein YndB with AHSA1/START domain
VREADPDGERLVATRLLKAPPELVWRAFTRPEHVAAFWGGHHASVPPDSVDIDLRPGGAFELTTVGPDGRRHRLRFVFTEITEPKRLVFTEPEVGIVTSIELTPRAGLTLLTLHQWRVPPHLAGPAARAGLAGILDRLEDLLHRMGVTPKG